MALLLRCAVALVLVAPVNAGWSCGSGWESKSGSPSCVGSDGATCSDSTCCNKLPTCQNHMASWVGATFAGGGCLKGDDDQFFDLKKLDVAVAANADDVTIKAACCTAFANAKCSDWNLQTCNDLTANYRVDANDAPADGPAGASPMTTLSDASFQTKCCAARSTCSGFSCPSTHTVVSSQKCTGASSTCNAAACCVAKPTCQNHMAVWVGATLVGGGCLKGDDDQFFDLKKLDVAVAADADEVTVKAACCTAFANAKCSDWNLQTCNDLTANYKVHANDAPADGPAEASPMTTLSDASFQTMCCAARSTCSGFSCPAGMSLRSSSTKCSGASSSCDLATCCTGTPTSMKCDAYAGDNDASQALRSAHPLAAVAGAGAVLIAMQTAL